MHRKRLAGAAGAVALTVLLAGCGGEPGPKESAPDANGAPSPSASSPSASASSDPKSAEEQAALAAYQGMWRAHAVAVQKASEKGTRIEDYASGEALATIRQDIRTMREAGTRANGKLGHEPKAKVDLKSSPPTATITDCLDLKDWETTRDGKPLPLPSEQPMRYRTTAQAEQWDDGRWRVIQYTQHGEQTC
ncbi:hypothetical protein [Streptomyces sp. CBG9]|uniref:hypothetical protein n=1 Tax=Streptomyces sp. CBG9 TaxID=2762622 RepID=UPI0016471E85|nr:hypothetical protein [Streptomyces sp. CBG9]